MLTAAWPVLWSARFAHVRASPRNSRLLMSASKLRNQHRTWENPSLAQCLKERQVYDESLDHVVSANQHQSRHGDVDRLGRLKVDGKPVLCRQFNRQIGGLPPLDNFIDEGGGLTIGRINIVSIGHQATGSNKRCAWGKCRKSTLD